jgi:hypothetical protein
MKGTGALGARLTRAPIHLRQRQGRPLIWIAYVYPGSVETTAGHASHALQTSTVLEAL